MTTYTIQDLAWSKGVPEPVREALLSLQAEAESLRDLTDELDKKLALLEAAEASLNAQVSQLEKQLDNEYLMGFEGGREWAAKVCDGLAEKDRLSNYYAVAARAIREGEKK